MTNRYWLGLIDCDGREIAAQGYSRQPVELRYLRPGMFVQVNVYLVTFGPIAEAWGHIERLAFFSAETGGELLGGKSVSNLKMKKGKVFKIEPGEIAITLDLDDDEDEDVTEDEG